MLAERAVTEISTDDVNNVFAGNLWALSPVAFRYYLPALMRFSLISYRSVSVFASELVGALTRPERDDVTESLDRLDLLSSEIAPSVSGVADLLRSQQLEWFDSGAPTATFHERFDDLSAAEGDAVLRFLETFQEAHGADFPFGELDAAITRYWSRFRASPGAESTGAEPT
ncbi:MULTISPECIES: hypothetical protein [Parafrankia]|uniref:hypothetical protein n=1 Tax=Parafrankia TaxID=2994362 RepID=UPI001A9783B7|nr:MULTISPECIES: hypothetical protein [Parafrankia]